MLSEERVNLAIEVITRGEPFTIGELNLALDLTEKNKVIVSFPSSRRIEFTSKQRACADLNEATKILTLLRQTFSSLDLFLSPKKVVFRIVDDYGMGGIDICCQIDGKITFAEGIND